MPPHFQQNVKWWQGHINCKNTKTRRFEFTPFQLFPYTTPEEREEYYDTEGEGEYSPGTLRYDRVGAGNHREPDLWQKALEPCPDSKMYV